MGIIPRRKVEGPTPSNGIYWAVQAAAFRARTKNPGVGLQAIRGFIEKAVGQAHACIMSHNVVLDAGGTVAPA